jgi:hypothetical protein
VFEVSHHLQALESEHLRLGDERIGAAVPGLDRLVDEVVGLGGLLSDGVDGVLEDLARSRRAMAGLGPLWGQQRTLTEADRGTFSASTSKNVSGSPEGSVLTRFPKPRVAGSIPAGARHLPAQTPSPARSRGRCWATLGPALLDRAEDAPGVEQVPLPNSPIRIARRRALGSLPVRLHRCELEYRTAHRGRLDRPPARVPSRRGATPSGVRARSRPSCSPFAEQLIGGVRGRPTHPRDHGRVDVHREARARVAQPLEHGLDVYAGGQQLRRMRLSQVVEPRPRYSEFLDHAAEVVETVHGDSGCPMQSSRTMSYSTQTPR